MRRDGKGEEVKKRKKVFCIDLSHTVVEKKKRVPDQKGAEL